MNTKNKHINISHSKIPGILLKTLVVFGLMFMFIQNSSLKAQVINNEGAAISITNGATLQGDTLENNSLGIIENNGTLGLRGNFYNLSGTTEGNGYYNLEGNWVNTDIFSPDNSTVIFMGDSIQTISSTGGELFYNFRVENTASAFANNRVVLLNNVNVTQQFDFFQGNIETGANTLYLENQNPGALNYTATDGSRVIGKFERGVGNTSNYLFPIGSEENYNPMNLSFNDVTPGSILSEFVASDPDSIGLPLPDPGYVIPTDTVEVYNADSVGYWSVQAQNGFASTNYDVNLSGSGFSEVQNASRIIKRPDGGDWELDGVHKDGTDSVAYRNTLGGVENSGNHYGWGHIRPRIQKQPEDTAICDGESATFSIVATGRGTLTYEWEVLEGSGGWQPITDNAIYANSNTDTLLIIAADTSMNGYKYRVIVTDSLGNFHRSNSQATLTVSPRPVVTATPQNDTICNGGTTFIELNSTVPGTTFTLDTLYTGSILGADLTIVDDTTIQQTLTNPTLYADSVVYRIFPTGPTYPYCGGTADTVVIWVEPTVTITALDDTICNGDFTAIDVRSPNITTNGIHFTWTSSATDPDVTGFTNNATGQDTLLNITDQLVNIGLDSAIVHYTITPWALDASGNLKCSGTPINIDIWVEPTVSISAVNDTLCDGDNTNIVVSSTNTTTNGIRYTWTYIDNDQVTGETASTGSGQVIGSAISHQLINNSYEKQLVQYIITPWTVNASNENECTDAAEVITIDIWVEPTPKVFTTILKDTICNDERTNITLTTPNVMTVGVVTFDYTSTADAGLTGNSNDTNRPDSFVITDSLHNSTTGPAIPQVARYTITPRSLATGCADGPSVVDSITVHPTADTYMSTDSVRCYLESNGTATVLAENGINIFTYEWDDPLNQTNSTATGLIEDVYTVTVTDNQGCIKIDSVNVGQPDLLVPFIDTVKNVSCNGRFDGYIIADPYGGNGQYNYLWSTGETTDSIGSLNGNYYYLTVTDWKGCLKDTTVLLDEPPQTSMDILTKHISCYGANDGELEVDAIGLTNYEWSTGATTAKITNLHAGFYSVTAFNAEGCKSTQSQEVHEPDPLVIDSIVPGPISCAGDADGTVDLYVSGGNTINYYTDIPFDEPYNYSWTTTDGTGLTAGIQNQSGLSGGTYYVTVSDWRNCMANDSATVNEPPEYSSTIAATDVTCFGDNNGEIDLQVTGGNTEDPYTFVWTTPNGSGLSESSEDQSGLTQGDYYVTIYDAKDCELQNNAVISEPPLLEATVSEEDLNCFGINDGSAVVDITGGTGAYSIEWSTGSTEDSIYNLAAGNYSVTVIDANGCDTINNFQLSEPDEIESSFESENITCFGYSNGKIVITTTGGTIPYNYVWSDASIANDSIAENLGPGQYTVSVIDNNNCEHTRDIELTQPDPLTADVEKSDITCYGEIDGYIVLNMFGGTPEYTYSWSNGLSEPSANMLSEGDYSITVTDIHDCLIDTTIHIEEPDELTINPIVIRPTCPDIENGSIDLNINGGRTPYIIYWDNGSFDENLSEIRSGIYDVLITDSSLCELDTSFTVRSAHDFCIDIPTAFSPNDDNINDKWVIDMQGLYPYAEVEIFDRWGNRVFYSKGYEESQYWDGTVNGKKLPMDNYFYIIYLRNGSRRISGTVTLLR